MSIYFSVQSILHLLGFGTPVTEAPAAKPLPPELLHFHIIPSIKPKEPNKLTAKEIKEYAVFIKNISLCSKNLRNICLPILEDLKKSYFRAKYSSMNKEYENPPMDWQTGMPIDPKGPPQLTDALLSGYKRGNVCNKHSYDEYTPEVEKDIKEIVKSMPESINCVLGHLRCRENVPPLEIACLNDKVPLHIIEFLLEHGANPDASVMLSNMPITIFADLKERTSIDPVRMAAIESLFNKYGFFYTPSGRRYID